MHSYTSSSDAPARKNWWQRLGRERLAWSLLLGIALIVLMGMLRQPTDFGMPKPLYWARKVQWQDVADMVVLGDSRVRCGIAPAAMREVLDNWRIYNYGFGANGFSPEYLQAAQVVLDQSSDRRAILLGVTPLALTEGALERNTFTEQMNRPEMTHFYGRAIPELLEFLEPMSFGDVWKQWTRQDTNNRRRAEFFADGWVSAWRGRIKPTQWLAHYHYEYTQSPVSEKVITWLLETVQHWRSAGIEVYAVRMPAHESMLTVEEQVAGFDEAVFAHRFTAAGGVWLDVNGEYLMYDGVHMVPDAARQFSRAVAGQIKMYRQTHNQQKTRGAQHHGG